MATQKTTKLFNIIIVCFILTAVAYFFISPTSFALFKCTDVPGRVSAGPGNCPSPSCTGGQRCVACDPGSIIPFHACQGMGPAVPNIINTEIGVLQAEPEKLLEGLSRILVYLSGGISLYLLLSGAAKYLFSSGNPETIEEAKGIITHALGGFALVFLSVFLLRFLGVDVLHIPGLELGPSGGIEVQTN